MPFHIGSSRRLRSLRFLLCSQPLRSCLVYVPQSIVWGFFGSLCVDSHRTRYVACATGVVYLIPLSCGRVYVGQTGRCVNVRAREHSLSLRSSPSGHLAVHCDRCMCPLVFTEIKILARHHNKVTREIDEAFFIATYGEDTCVSAPSVALANDEVAFIRKFGKFV
ncbi:unnamed protein product [Ixodes hexagonus]